MIQLGINIDHIATLRNARGDFFPSLVYAASIVEASGGDFITIHLREDRRHIKDNDLYVLKDNITTYLNLEMACNENVLAHALKAKPYKVTLVPEKREEVTTEGGLNITDPAQLAIVKKFTQKLKDAGIKVSLFIEANTAIIENCIQIGADEIEIHTGKYSTATHEEQSSLLYDIAHFSKEADGAGLKVCAGHGLTYHNTQALCRIKEIKELNIGYSIITRSIFDGLSNSVREMKRLIREAAVLCSE